MGTMKYRDGDVYEGDWLEGEMHGKGIMKYLDDDIYEGDWFEGKRQGKGT